MHQGGSEDAWAEPNVRDRGVLKGDDSAEVYCFSVISPSTKRCTRNSDEGCD